MADYVVIPSIGASERLASVVQAALSSRARVAVIENQEDDERHSPSAEAVLMEAGLWEFVSFIRAPDKSIYWAWNTGMAFARTGEDETPVAVILNDDIEIPRGTIDNLILSLKANPLYAVLGADYFTPNLDPVNLPTIRPVRGTYRHGGIGGFAFACRADICRVDEQFEIWYGDDDLVFDAMDRGYGIGILDGAPVRHPTPETTTILFPELSEAKSRDRERFELKWGR